MKYEIETINSDNRRPGMPETGYIVRYGVSDCGYKYMKVFASSIDANTWIEKNYTSDELVEMFK